MNKTLLIIVFVALFIFMIADLIVVFSNVVKAVFYGAFFIVGVGIYLYNNGVPKIDFEKKNADKK